MSNIPGLFFLTVLISGAAFGSVVLMAVMHSVGSFFSALTAITDKGKTYRPAFSINSSFKTVKAIPRIHNNGERIWFAHIHGEGMRTERYYR